METNLVKQDINFLEFPLWMQDSIQENKEDGKFVWKDRSGFVYESGFKPPVKTDIIFLYALLLRSQKNEWEGIVELSRYQLLKDCGLGKLRNSYWYQRIEESLERWMHVVISFEETLYNGEKKVKGQFHVLDDWKIDEETKSLRVCFSPSWLKQIKDSTYYRRLDFEQIKALRSPLATRLYEILIKTFQTRSDWSCGAKKLAAKIPMNEKYVSDIIPKIQTAVKRINEKTELQIKLEVKRPERGKALFYFEKTSIDKVSKKKEVSRELLVESKRLPEKKKEPESVEVPKKEPSNFEELVALLPKEHQQKKTIRAEISKQLRKNGADYVRGNILYTNENATDKYRSYLNKALKENWGEGYLEDLEKREEKRRIRRKEEERKREEEKKQEDLEQKAHDQFQALTPKAHQKLEEEAKKRLQAHNSSFLQGSFASIAIKMQMKVILIEQIKEQLAD